MVVWAHTKAHTSIWVSNACVPGLWKCQISGLEGGRGPPPGDTQRQKRTRRGGYWDGPISALFSPCTLPPPPPLLNQPCQTCLPKPGASQRHCFHILYFPSFWNLWISNPPSLFLLYHHICPLPPPPPPPPPPPRRLLLSCHSFTFPLFSQPLTLPHALPRKSKKQKCKAENGCWPEKRGEEE